MLVWYYCQHSSIDNYTLLVNKFLYQKLKCPKGSCICGDKPVYGNICFFDWGGGLSLTWACMCTGDVCAGDSSLFMCVCLHTCVFFICAVCAHICLCVCIWVSEDWIVQSDCSPLGSSVHGILRARILEWVVIPFSLPEYFPDPGIQPGSPALKADSLPSELPGKPQLFH